MKWCCRGHWGHWGCWGCWGHSGRRSSKAWKITTGDFRVIQVLEFSFILMFWKIKILTESWKIMLNFSIFSVGGCWGQPISIFWKLADETQMGNPRYHAARDISSKFSIFLPLRAILKNPYHYETPCILFVNRSVLHLESHFLHWIQNPKFRVTWHISENETN